MEYQPNRLLRPAEAMNRLGCKNTKFWSIVQTGVLDVRKLGGATVITEASVEKFIAELPRVDVAVK